MYCLLSLFILIGFCSYNETKKSPEKEESPSPPNIVLLFTEEQGYGDVGVFGADDMCLRLCDSLKDMEGSENRELGRIKQS